MHTHTHIHAHTHTTPTLVPHPPRPLSSLPLPPCSPCSPGSRRCLGGGPGLSPALQALWPCSRPAVCPAHGDSGPAASYPQGTRVSATRSPAHLSSFTALLCLRGRKKGQRRVQPGQRSSVSSPKLCVVAPGSLLVMARVNLSMHPPVPPPHPLALGCLGAGWWDGPSADFTPPSSSLNTGAPRLAELLVNG